jgi:hypothetical protein
MEKNINKTFVVVLVIGGGMVYARSSLQPTDTTNKLEEAAKYSSVTTANLRRSQMTTNWVARAKIMELHTEMKPILTLHEV